MTHSERIVSARDGGSGLRTSQRGLRGPVRWDRLIGLVLVLMAHAIVLYELWNYRLLPTPMHAETLFVSLIAPEPPPPKPPVPREAPRPRPPPEAPKAVEPPRPAQLAIQAPVAMPDEPVASPPPAHPAPPSPEPAPPGPAATLAPPPRLAGPVNLGTELAVSCPRRTPPVYPSLARRRGEQGRVVLRVALDERGDVVDAGVQTSSGSSQLDEAALSAVRAWHCNPARRDGVAVQAVALQPFNFILEGP
jgi:periplasmic protein TonB